MIDSHAHMTSRQFDDDREEALGRAWDAGVDIIINPSTDVDDSVHAIELAEKHDRVFACVGIHPHEAGKAGDDDLRKIEELSRHPKVVAIGEIGLDYHYDFAPRERQIEVFKAQIGIAQRRNLPIVIHTRESHEDTVNVVEAAIEECPLWRNAQVTSHSRFPAPRGVFHCFSGDEKDAWHAINLGFYISFPGIVTFKNAGIAATVAARVPAEHLLLETDSPYLAPVPHRGKKNEPMYVPLIAQKVADLQNLPVQDIVTATDYSAYRLFGVGEAPEPEIVYRLKNAVYINLTNRCNADCVFCDRKGDAVVKGHNLKITREPESQEVIAAIGDPSKYEEVVFCGYGEPTIRLEVLREVGRWVKDHGGRTRLNTDGHGNVINKRNIVPELAGVIDSVSISLNSADPDQYGKLMGIDGRKFFPEMKEFAKEAVRLLPKVVMTVVDLNDVDKEKARKLVEEEIGATFHPRAFF